ILHGELDKRVQQRTAELVNANKALQAEITERERAEQRIATHHAVTQALAESATLGDTAKKILQIICQTLKWDVGELWTLDRTTRRLRCVEIWHPPSTEFNEFGGRRVPDLNAAQ